MKVRHLISIEQGFLQLKQLAETKANNSGGNTATITDGATLSIGYSLIKRSHAVQ